VLYFGDWDQFVIIRDDQWNLLEQDAHRRFVDRLCAHFDMFWPEHVEAWGEQYRQIIENGVKRAKMYGFVTEQDIARFINLWFIWGVEFETEPSFRWASEIVSDPSRRPELKIHQLTWRTQQELALREEAGA